MITPPYSSRSAAAAACLVYLWLLSSAVRYRSGRSVVLVLLGLVVLAAGLAVATWMLRQHGHPTATIVVGIVSLVIDLAMFAVVPAVTMGIANP